MAESATPSPGRIFISYRREETAYPAGWLFDRLADHFGGGQVFKDVDSIQLGDDFVEVITRAVGSCDVLLALIGDQWLTIPDEDGRRRLDDPADFVRVEIEAALTRNVRVIPILVDGARMPRAAELPRNLAKLVRRQALELSPARFDFDLSRLLRVLDTTLSEQRTAQEDAASMKAPEMKAPEPNTEVQEAPGRPAQAEPSPTPSLPPATPAMPAGPSPSDSPKPPGKQRRRLSTRARVLTGAGVGVALIVAIVAIVANSGTTPSSTESVIFQDDFSSQANGWAVVSESGGSGDYTNDAYRVSAKPVAGGTGEAAAPQNAGRVYPSAPSNLRVEVEARMITGDQYGTYGILCRADAVRGYAFSIANGFVTIVKYTDNSYNELRSQDTSAINANGINRIQAVCSSEGQQAVHLVFNLNGQAVAKATDTKNPFLTGTVGIFAVTGPDSKKAIEAEFDNFVVTQMPGSGAD